MCRWVKKGKIGELFELDYYVYRVRYLLGLRGGWG